MHLYLIHVYDDLIEGGDKWTQIKNMIRLDEFLNEEQQNQLWDLLEESLHGTKGSWGHIL